MVAHECLAVLKLSVGSSSNLFAQRFRAWFAESRKSLICETCLFMLVYAVLHLSGVSVEKIKADAVLWHLG